MNPERPIKVGASGSLGSGKTTLLERMGQLPHIAKVEEFARPFFEANPQIVDRGALDVQMAIIEGIIAEEERVTQQAMEEGKSVILCDRSVLDGVAYATIYGDHEGAEKLLSFAKDHLPSYDGFLICDIKGIRLKRDPIRIETPQFRRRLHRTLIRTYSNQNIPFTLVTGNEEERFKLVNDHIQTLRNRTLL